MGKASKWLKHFLTGKKKKDKEKNGKKPTTLLTGSGLAPFSVPVPKEKRRWSFRRPTATGKDSNSPDPVAPASSHRFSDAEVDKKRHTMAMALAATAAPSRSNAIEETAAIKIQTLFRAYLARKALCALKGLVKLQALVRGHLVRMRAAATLHCMQALITAQARVRVQRIQMLKEAQSSSRWQHNDRRSPQHPRYLQSYEMDKSAGENVKIVEMDLGQTCSSSRSRHSYSGSTDRVRQWNSSYVHYRRQFKMDTRPQVSPSPSTLTDMSPRTYSGRFGELSFAMAQSSPRCLSAASNMHDTPRSSFSTSPHEGTHAVPHGYSFPNYMANTESSRAKARSQSAPKQRPDACERQTSRKRASVEGRNIPRSICMQRSASHVGSAGSMHQCPWSLKVDRSNMSLKDNECDSTSTGLTNTNNCRSVVADTNS